MEPDLQVNRSVLQVIIITISICVVGTEPNEELGEQADDQKGGGDDGEDAEDLHLTKGVGGVSEGPEVGELAITHDPDGGNDDAIEEEPEPVLKLEISP